MKIAQYIDHTLLKATTTDAEVVQLCKEAKKYKFYAVCVNSCYVELCANELKGSSVKIASVVGFYTLFHDAEEKGGRFRIQVCTDLPCALRGADAFLEQLCKNIGIKVGETTSDGMITIEAVTCLAGCNHAPVFQVQGDGELTYHEDQTVESAEKTIDELRKRGKKEDAA